MLGLRLEVTGSKGHSQHRIKTSCVDGRFSRTPSPRTRPIVDDRPTSTPPYEPHLAKRASYGISTAGEPASVGRNADSGFAEWRGKEGGIGLLWRERRVIGLPPRWRNRAA